ncbi:o-succinylbenzoate--CoA ligase [Halalkalibacillus halophilus]|uniref:o-succinylbenzoate--CoA ligase n=1 Tax=Halalkalibacillus halophilus TaxID=392827 RepID=UPI0012ECA40C
MINWLDKRADLSPDTEAIVLPDGASYTFEKLREDALAMAHTLVAEGIRPGDHIAVLSENSYRMVVLIYAIHYVNAVAVMLNTRLSHDEWRYQLKDSGVTFLIASEQYENSALNLQSQQWSFINLDNLKLHVTPSSENKSFDQNQVAQIIYTSGTTGKPKGVQLTYDNHWWSAIGSALNLGVTKSDRWLLALPLFHVGGLSILYRSVIYGMPVHLHNGFDAKSIHHEIMHNGITIVSVVTVMLQSLVDLLSDNRYPETFRAMLLGGGPAPKQLLNLCKKLDIPVFQTYGMTETASQFSTLDENYALEKLGSAGKPLFPNELKIVKDQPEHQAGEIYVKGPSVTKGYWNRQEANEQAFEQGWFKTGDLGQLDEDGFLYLLDRRKDLIISGGENIYPAEVESVLQQFPDIQEAAVVAKEDNKWGEIPVAYIVADQRIDVEGLSEHCAKALAKYKVPKQFIFIDHLPRNASKKVMRHKLKQRLIEKEGDS